MIIIFCSVLISHVLSIPWDAYAEKRFQEKNSFMIGKDERAALREEAKGMFYHGYNNYMKHAFPWDELKPLSCKGRRWDRRNRGDLDDTLGGYSLTLIDSLDMLAVIGDLDEFDRAVKTVIHTVRFDRDVRVSVFETTIRVIGGLLSAHMLASSKYVGLLPNYLSYQRPKNIGEKIHTQAEEGALLTLAIDVAERLLVAFDTPTSLPEHRVNLLLGKIPGEKKETCPAAAGSLLLEMALLSRLSGRPEFENAARKAVEALWTRRSKFHLLGSSIDVRTGKWLQSDTGIGAGLDSFYEYLLKYAVLFGEEEWFDRFQDSYESIERHVRRGDFHVQVDMNSGKEKVKYHRVSALQAFWPGLQVLAGDVSSAIESHRRLFDLWSQYSAMPEVFDLQTKQVIGWARNYPLRPELAESTYHLYQATRDPFYLTVGRRILFDLQNNTKVECGYASISNVHTLSLEDRMDSYFLSETVKYLYLLFKNENEPIVSAPPSTDAAPYRNLMPSNVVFSTEGHLFVVSKRIQAKQRRRNSKKPATCQMQMYSFEARSKNKTRYHQRIESKMSRCKANKDLCDTQFPHVSISIANNNQQQQQLDFLGNPAVFGGVLDSHPIQGKLLMLMDIETNATSFGCDPIVQDIEGAIVFVARGQCTFVQKARHVQQAGGVAMIVENVESKKQYFVLTDDSTGKDIDIPVAMMFRQDAIYLRRKLSRWQSLSSSLASMYVL